MTWSTKLQIMLGYGVVDDGLVATARHIVPSSSTGDPIALALIERIKVLGAGANQQWIVLMQFIEFSRFYRHDIREALRVQFFSFVPDATEARASVVQTMLNIGHRFYPIDLEGDLFFSIKREMPWVWELARKRSIEE